MSTTLPTRRYDTGNFYRDELLGLIHGFSDKEVSSAHQYKGLRFLCDEMGHFSDNSCPRCNHAEATYYRTFDMGEYFLEGFVSMQVGRRSDKTGLHMKMLRARSDLFDLATMLELAEEYPQIEFGALRDGDALVVEKELFDTHYLYNNREHLFVGKGSTLNCHMRYLDQQSQSKQLLEKIGLFLSRHGLHRLTRFAPHDQIIATVKDVSCRTYTRCLEQGRYAGISISGEHTFALKKNDEALPL